MVDDADFDALNKYAWHLHLGHHGGKYATRLKNGKLVYMHREILQPGDGFLTDHINGNGLDNRRANLRPCNMSQNQANRLGRNACGFKGVKKSHNCNRFEASYRKEGKRIYVGMFKTAQEAFNAYKTATQKAHGQFANFGHRK